MHSHALSRDQLISAIIAAGHELGVPVRVNSIKPAGPGLPGMNETVVPGVSASDGKQEEAETSDDGRGIQFRSYHTNQSELGRALHQTDGPRRLFLVATSPDPIRPVTNTHAATQAGPIANKCNRSQSGIVVCE